MLSTFGRYVEKLRSSRVAASARLVAVELAVKTLDTVPSGCGLSVAVASGRRTVVETGFDAATLRRLVQVPEGM